MRSTPPAHPGLSVTIVSSNAETLHALDAYLRGVGVISNGTRLLDRVLDVTPPSSTAVVVFPDEFEPHRVDRALASLGKARPDLLLVIVTHEPQRFHRTVARSPDLALPLVIPKPAWAWTILDAIRARLDSSVPDGPA